MTQIELQLDAPDPAALVARLELAATGTGISRVAFRRRRSGAPRPETGRNGELLRRAREEIAEFLAGQRTFFGVPVDLALVPPFERSALEVAAQIPFGEVRTYKWIAEQLGSPEGAQLVGIAMASNPVPILVPCHRVVKSDGGLGGYSFGLMQKAALLNLERSVPPFVGCVATRVVCRRGCAHERSSQGARIPFVSLADARTAGYGICNACRPRTA
jgi:methylated-DNA-[protein]-cysteine S-methyltransferase